MRISMFSAHRSSAKKIFEERHHASCSEGEVSGAISSALADPEQSRNRKDPVKLFENTPDKVHFTDESTDRHSLLSRNNPPVLPS